MKKVEVVKAKELDIKPFIFSDFRDNIEKLPCIKKVSKKELKRLAEEIGLEYSNEQIQFSKNLLEAYLAKR